MSEKDPAPLRDVTLECPACHHTVKLISKLPFTKQSDGLWHADAIADCVACSQKVELHLRVNADGRVEAPVPGFGDDPEWTLLGYMDFDTGAIAAL